MKVIIIGAGIIGITTAWYLAQRGAQVVVFDARPGPAEGCSFANGGQFSYAYSEPLASPAMRLKLSSLLFRRDHTLRLGSGAFPSLIPWGWKFLRNCTGRAFQSNLSKVLKLALYSRGVLHDLLDHHELSFDYRRTGKLHVYGDAADLVEAEKVVRLKAALDCHQKILDRQTCLAHEPMLAHFGGELVGGIFSPLDESGDTRILTHRLMERLVLDGTCTFRFKEPVVRIERVGDRVKHIATSETRYEADTYIVCAGALSGRLLRPLGLRLAIQAVKGYSITVPATPQTPDVNITDMSRKMVYTRLGDRLRIAGTMHINGYDERVSDMSIHHLLNTASERFPLAGDYQNPSSAWAGLRPMTPDGAPFIGETAYHNLLLNTGHGMLGSTLSFGSARLLTDLLYGTKPTIPTEGFRTDRFYHPPS
ncbi:MAG: D-amino acid dehydrogenase [Pseudomonadota bacterium]